MALPDYTDTEHMIFRGFLSEAAEVGGVPIVFKTINQTEYELSLLYAQSSNVEENQLLQECYFIANSVFLFNRTSVLDSRDAFLGGFVDLVLEWPASVRYKILARLQNLNARALEAIKRVEGFSYGEDSRQRWSLLKHLSPNDPRVTGVSGTQFLGLTMHQRLWFYYNTLDDKQEAFDLDWSRTKFQASVHSKEIGKIDSQDKTRKRDEWRRRDAIYRGDNPEDGTRGVNGELKVSNEDVSDLLGQLKRDIEGQKDFHDLVVEEHERKIRENYRQMQEAQAKKAIEARKQTQARIGHDLKDPVIFYDEETVKQLTSQRRESKRKALLGGQYAEESGRAVQTERMKKWGILDEEAPPIAAQSEHPLSGTLLDDYYDVKMPDMTKGSPFDDE